VNAPEIRVATVEDLPRIVQMKLEMFREAGHEGLLARDAGDLVLADYRRLYELGLARHFVAHAGELVGMAGAFLKSDIPFRYFETPTYGFIGDVYTDPGLRRRQVAEHLSRLALDWLWSKEVKMVRLLASDAGRALYEKLGFQTSDEMVLANAS
jgi:GNAT superfamily N-acetyltransferase